jgi:glycosyltransferase involved in cell wall biosynthesis
VKATIPETVLLIGNFLSGSMVTRHVCEDMAQHLTANGWMTLCASTKLGKFPRAVDMVKTTWQRRREYRVAHVECYSGHAFVWAEAVGYSLRWLGKPFILTLHSGNFPLFARRWPRRVQRLLRTANVVTTPSRYLREKMRPYRADLRLIPNALDVKPYPFRLRSKPQPRLVWLRAFLDYYNPFLGPKVMAQLIQEFPDARLTMVGPDKGDGSLARTRQLSAELGVAEHISFPGGIPKADVPRCFDQHDIFINTTNRDNTPVSVMEAMACGLSVVSTNVDGVPYLVDHEVDGLLVPPDDAAAMSAAVRRLLTEPGLAERLTRKAREKVARFDWSLVLPQWEELYRQIMIPSPAADDARILTSPQDTRQTKEMPRMVSLSPQRAAGEASAKKETFAGQDEG